MSNQSYRDPQGGSIQRDTGLTSRAIINACKRNAWPWRKIYGRIWVCADFVTRYEAKHGKLD
jgi:hypothetical protein